ncbi:MAG: dTDP-4-dehydrorhamnose reductase [Saccharospirillaceae bacterium]|nr:dTDP-4-dehydrorhamnose reductase [Saccharospirillaceae bacterium]MCD8530217.1 dTDP-4-dehydrorhamnose reductase [Saccharospirillaceae bacterium]
MRVLITAKNGQLGWELARTAPAELTANNDLLLQDSTELDITNALQVMQRISEFKPDIVINAAAYTAVDKAESDADAAYAVNERGVKNLAQACKEHSAKLIHVSTDFVFDASKNTPYQPGDITGPLGVYGASKLAGEKAAQDILGGDVAIVRTAWVYSVHGNNFVKTMLRLMAEKEQLGIVADQVGTPTSANNLAAALWALASVMHSGSDRLQPLYHWTDLGTASWYDFAVAIQELALEQGLLNKAIPVNPIKASQYPTPAKRPAYSVLDSTALRELTAMSGVHWRKALTLMIKELAQ